MENECAIDARLSGIEGRLREIFELVNEPTEKMNLMQLRVAAYRKINAAVEMIDKVLEVIETEFITEAPSVDDLPSVVFLNKQQEETHNDELHFLASQLREIRWLLVSPPKDYQNVTKEIAETGTQ